MSQNFVTTSSIVVINYNSEDKNTFYLLNKSFIRDETFLTSQMSQKDFQNSLFYVEIDGHNKDLKISIEFGQSILFRHKISNKYLSHSEEFEEEENDTTYKLKLSHKKHTFKLYPCFQYQTKITNKVKFQEDIYLATSIFQSSKLGYISTRQGKFPHLRKTLLGLNYKAKFSISSYYQTQKQEVNYTFGSIVWLSHIESSTFLNTKRVKNKEYVTFEPLQFDKDLQAITGLWLIESEKLGVGGKISFEEKFRLKNIFSGAYLSFEKNYKMNENQRVYKIIVDEVPTEQSLFVFKSLKGEENKIKKGSYLIFRHHESRLYLGCRKNNTYINSGFDSLKPISYAYFEDEDLFQIFQFNENEEEAIRFILSMEDEINAIKNLEVDLTETKEIFQNIQKQLQKLKNFERLFQKVQGQVGGYIPKFCELIKMFKDKFRENRENQIEIASILRLIYSILKIICYQNKSNQEQSYDFIHYYADDIFQNIGAEELLIETFRNHYKLLCKVPEPISGLRHQNIVKATLNKIQWFCRVKDDEYWQKLNKYVDFLKEIMKNGQSTIDINQRVISEELFEREYFPKIFFGIKIINQRIKVEDTPSHFMQIQRVSGKSFNLIIEETFALLSLLCSQRNYIAKKCIHKYLNSYNQNGIEILIAYLNLPITPQLSNNLYSLISNLYIDSYPRLQRYKPLSILKFAITPNYNSVREQSEMSDRLRTNLLRNNEASYRSRPLHVNEKNMKNVHLSAQPTLSEDELSFYKEELYEKIKHHTWSIDLLKSVEILIVLQSYNRIEMADINDILISKLKDNKLHPGIMIGIMSILQKITKYSREIELNKLSDYLKYKYKVNQQTINYSKEFEYILPYYKHLTPSKQNSSDVNEFIASYNNNSDLISRLNPDEQLKNTLLNLFTQYNQKNTCHYLEETYKSLIEYNFRNNEFAKILMNSIVISNEQYSTFQSIQSLVYQLTYFVSISEYWLCSEEGQENLPYFIQCLVELTNYLHENYEGTSEQNRRILNDYTRSLVKEEKIYVNRQLLIRNLGTHFLIFQLLESNFYLLENQNQKSKEFLKASQVFSLCFEFIYGFIYKCQETKQIVHKSWSILDKFQNLPEVGQSQVYNQLYANKIEYIREIKKTFIEKIIFKIIKDPKAKGIQRCQFNPGHLKYLQSIVKINETVYKPNLEKIYRIIEKDIIFKKMLFCEQINKDEVRLCLDMFKIKTDSSNIQIPYIYHTKIISLLNDMMENLQSQNSILRTKLQKLFSFDYLFYIMSLPDIYSHIGIQPQMIFILKREIMKILLIFMEKNDSIQKIHNNKNLEKLIDFYETIFIQRPKKKNIDTGNQALYIPYLNEYKKILDYYENNERTYYNTQIKPFLEKLLSIHLKANKESNIICEKIKYLLQNTNPDKMIEFYEFRKMDKNIDKVTFKWLNFVDRDENNSPEEKFAKHIVVQILRNNTIKQKLVNEKKNFYNMVQKKKRNQFTRVMIQLLNMEMEQELTEAEYEQTYETIFNILVVFSEFLENFEDLEQINEIVDYLLQLQLINIIIGFTTKTEFDFTKIVVRKVYHYILKILNFIISNDEELKAVKEMYKLFNSNKLMYRFWNHLSECILTMSEYVEGQKPHEQVNWCLNELYLCVEQHHLKMYEEALLFLQKLCEYTPFTNFLRYQPLYPSVDFMEIIFHSFNYLLKEINPFPEKQKLFIKVTTVDLAEKALKFMSAMMIGGNEQNQLYLIDNKFPETINEVLKMSTIKNNSVQADIFERNQLIEEVNEFYRRNGIDIGSQMAKKIRIMDFHEPYLINRFKYSLLTTLMECITNNEKGFNKVKLQIPPEFLKINIIWVYEEYIEGNYEFTEKLILRETQDWKDALAKENLNGLFLMIGFYFFYLIQNNSLIDDEKNQEQDTLLDDKEKNKQKIVKKFFKTISDKEKKAEKISKIENQPFAAEMRQFYEKYYEALEFFRGKSISIEVNFIENLTRIYFPKIPLCNGVTEKMTENFKQTAIRISQEEKIKSLLQFQEQTYQLLQGQENFYSNFENLSCLGLFIRYLNEDVLRLVALVSCFIVSILFLLANFFSPSFVFSDNISVNPATAIDTALFIIGIINIIIAFLLLFYLLTKKLPIYLTLLEERERKRDDKERDKFLSGPIIFKIKQLLREIMYTLYIIIFLVLSFVQPMFAGFVLFDIMNRMQLGRQILRSIKQTWIQLLAATVLLIVINYFYAFYVYLQWTQFYSPTCQILWQCLLLLLDQSLKSDSGFLGSTPVDYNKSIFNLKFFSEILYIIFAQKVVFEVFSGTIIDKFSELRQQNNKMLGDEASFCYICGQERFVIDFQLQGFTEHTQQSHNSMNYVFYLYYLRRKKRKDYGIVDKYVYDCQKKQKKYWIPDQTSILKEEKDRLKTVEHQEDEMKQRKDYFEKKIKEIKALRSKSKNLLTDLKIGNDK